MAQGTGNLSGQMRELSEKLGAAHEAASARREAAERNKPDERKIQINLFVAVFGLITAETLAGFYFFGFPGFVLNVERILGWGTVLIIASMFSVNLLLFLVILTGSRMERKASARLLTASTSGVVVNTDIVQSTLATGKVGYLTRVNYVYEIGADTHEGAWRPRNIAHRVQRKLDSAKAAWPPGKVVEVFYDPANPAASSLAPGSTNTNLWLVIFFLTLVVSAGNIHLFLPVAPFAAVILGVAMLLGVRMQYYHV